MSLAYTNQESGKLNRLARFGLYPKAAYSNLSLCNFHLATDSPCVNMGDPNETAATEGDMDKQARIAGTSVEMGADEVDCEEVFNPLDWDADGLVNLAEFNLFSHAWLAAGSSDPNSSDPNYISVCDLNSDWIVDVDDLELFIPEWLWSACWRYDISAMQQQASAMMTQSNTLLSESLNTASIDVRAMKAELTESSETETSLTLSLINQINGLIDTDQENAETWQEMKYLLEQNLLETEKTRIKTAEF